jgi:hypothetical protein
MTSDNEIMEIGSRPFGLRRKSGHTSFSPLIVDFHNLRARPRLAGFSLATPFA